MAMRTLKNLGRPILPRGDRSAQLQDGRENRGPETCPSLERDADPHGRPLRERGKDFDDERVR